MDDAKRKARERLHGILLGARSHMQMHAESAEAFEEYESVIRAPLEAIVEAAQAVTRPAKWEGDLPEDWLEDVAARVHPERCQEHVDLIGPHTCTCGVLEGIRWDYGRHLAIQGLRAALAGVPKEAGRGE